MFMFSKKVWHTESFIWKMESDIIKALEFWEPYLRFEILRASWLMLTIQTVNTDSSVRYNNNIVAHNKTPAITTKLEIMTEMTELWFQTQQTLDSLSQTRSLWATLPLQRYETEATYLCVLIYSVIIKSISPRIMSHTQSPLGSFSPVIIGLLIPPGFILCDCFFHPSFTNAR